MHKQILRKVYTALGLFFVGLGAIGAFLPVMPTVPFLIAAAFFFSKGSPRLHHWLLSRPVIGQVLSEWEEYRVIRIKAKIFATAAMLLMCSYPIFIFDLPLWVKLGTTAICLGILGFIWSCPSSRGKS